MACKTAPTVSRSSFAGAVVGIAGLASASGDAAVAEGWLGRSSGAASAGALGLRIGDPAAGFAGALVAGREGPWPWDSASVSSSVRFNALSIADIAAETGSGVEFCFAICPPHFLASIAPGSTDAPAFSPAWPRPAETSQLTTSQFTAAASI